MLASSGRAEESWRYWFSKINSCLGMAVELRFVSLENVVDPILVGRNVRWTRVEDDIAVGLAFDPKRPAARLCAILGGVVEDQIAAVCGASVLDLLRVVRGSVEDESVRQLILVLGGIVDVYVKLVLLLVHHERVRLWMSTPYALHASPARARLAVKPCLE